MDRIELTSPVDMHVHFRNKQMLRDVVPHTSRSFAGALVMPNVIPTKYDYDPCYEAGITSLEFLLEYRREIEEVSGTNFQPYMTLFFQTSYTREFLEKVKPHILAIKLYPQGITTNSEGGCDPHHPDVLRVLGYMEELGITLCVHGETNGFVMDRETEFTYTYEDWAGQFPKLKIIMEHITTERAAKLVRLVENLYATITVHHLLITLDSVVGGMLNPHLFCKPIAKRPEDLDNLRGLAFHERENKVMLGTDSAPHAKNKKESACGCAGVFTAPIALQLLAGLFSEHGVSTQRFQAFVSGNARSIYGINPPNKEVVLQKIPFTIPDSYGNVVPMWAGKTLEWSITSP